MLVGEVIAAFRTQIAAASGQGVTEVSLDSLSALVDVIEKQSQESPDGVEGREARMEQYRAELASWHAHAQRDHEADMQMLSATIETAVLAIKSALLINGGAAVAFLAFLGGVWPRLVSSSVKVALAEALACFTWGVLLTGLAAVMAYFSQAGFGGEFGKGKPGKITGHIGRWVGAGAVIASFVLFGLGCLEAGKVFSSGLM